MVIAWSRERTARTLAALRDAPSNFLQHAAAAGCVSIALLVRGLLDPILLDRQPFSLLFGAVALTVWLSGFKPALTATVLGYLGADYFFTEPRAEVVINSDQQFIGLVIYLASCAIVIAFGESLRRATERSRSYAKGLEAQRAELEQADRAKDQFLATLSHELRNPLMSVSYVASLLQRKSDVYPDLQQVAHLLGAQMDHLTHLVDDLLDLERIRTGQIRFQEEVLSVNEVVAAAVECMRPQTLRHSLVFKLPEQALTVSGDSARLTQVFTNLISNAIRYTPPGGTITVELARREAWAVARVRDTGIGIPQDQLENIFELLAQTSAAVELSRSGLGIGLALVRKLLHLHGGSVTAHSPGPNMGSEFVVRLPLHADDRGAAAR